MNKEELKEGMYVRTEYGISKIVNIFFEKTGTFIETDNGLGDCMMSTRGKLHKGIYIFEEDYKTFIDTNVKNTIIELIEKGDYVNGEEVDIFEIPPDYEEEELGFPLYDEDSDYFHRAIIAYTPLKQVEIKSIVTKEQFESVQYKVERG